MARLNCCAMLWRVDERLRLHEDACTVFVESGASAHVADEHQRHDEEIATHRSDEEKPRARGVTTSCCVEHHATTNHPIIKSTSCSKQTLTLLVPVQEQQHRRRKYQEQQHREAPQEGLLRCLRQLLVTGSHVLLCILCVVMNDIYFPILFLHLHDESHDTNW